MIYSKIDGSAVRIVESDNFDFIFSSLHKFTSISTSCKSSIIVILENGIKGITNKLTQIFRKDQDEYRQAALKYKNALKMYLYLLRWFISEEEKNTQESGTGRVSFSSFFLLC